MYNKEFMKTMLQEIIIIGIISYSIGIFISILHPNGFIYINKPGLSEQKVPETFSDSQLVFITPLETKIKLDSSHIILLDARSQENFSDEAIPGAINIPAYPQNKSKALLQKHASLLDKKQEIVLYCTSQDCSDAETLAQRILKRGYKRKLYIMRQGIEGWKENHFPLITGQ